MVSWGRYTPENPLVVDHDDLEALYRCVEGWDEKYHGMLADRCIEVVAVRPVGRRSA